MVTRETNKNLNITRDTRAGSCQYLLTAVSTGVAPEWRWTWNRKLRPGQKKKKNAERSDTRRHAATRGNTRRHAAAGDQLKAKQRF